MYVAIRVGFILCVASTIFVARYFCIEVLLYITITLVFVLL